MKTAINIVYSPQTGPASIIYENEKGVVWTSSQYNPNMINVGMGFYSIPDPKSQDCFMIMEPYCVLERDYDPDYVAKFRKVFTWASKAFSQPSIKHKIVEINHPSLHEVPSIDNLASQWKSWDERKNEIVFIANNKSSKHDSELYSFRLNLAEMLHVKSKYKVSWYGEIPINRSYYKGKISDKLEVLRNAKFSVCTENSYHPIYTHNYFTEKMPEVWYAGAVPIYMGCYNVDDFGFPAHSYIDLRTYVNKDGHKVKIDLDALVARIEGFDSFRYENYKQDLVYNMARPNGLFHIVSFSRVYEKMIDELSRHS